METVDLPNGCKFYCLGKGEALLLYKDLFEQRSYFRFDIRIPANATVVDVGANIGLFSFLAAREAKNVRVISLEPLPPIFAVLEANYDFHRIPGVALRYGIGTQSCRAAFTFYPGNTALSGRFAELKEETELVARILQNRFPQFPASQLYQLAGQNLNSNTFECDVVPLSLIIKDLKIDQVDLLKIDVEKSELDVLQSIDHSDWPKINQVVVEVHDIDSRLHHIEKLLEEKGFHIHSVQGAAFLHTGLYDLFARRS